MITWGDSNYGGDSSAVSSDLTSGVSVIYCTENAFAAVKSDGSVITWGDSNYGGDSSAVSSDLTSGVRVIYSTGSAFAALKSGGSVITWGDSNYGGDSSSGIQSMPANVAKVFGSTLYNSLSAVGCDSGSARGFLAVDGTWTTQSSCTSCTAGTYDSLLGLSLIHI